MAVHIWHNISISDANYKVGVTSDNEMKVAARVTGQPVNVIITEQPIDVSAAQSGAWSVGQAGSWSVNQAGTWIFTPASVAPVTSLNAVSATGAGTALDAGRVVSGCTLHVNTTGSPAAIDVEVQVSVDNVVWFDTGAAITVSGTSALASAHGRYYRANLTVLTGGTSPTVTAILATSF